MYEGIQEAKNQNEQIKKEYAEVTSHLKDIQLMDQALDEDKVVLLQTASAIDQLMKEREYLKKRRYKFNDAQRQAMENFETKAADDVKKLKKFEDYQIKVKMICTSWRVRSSCSNRTNVTLSINRVPCVSYRRFWRGFCLCLHFDVDDSSGI